MAYLQPPCRRSIIVGKKRVFLSFPYIIFDVGNLSNLNVYFLNEIPKHNTRLRLVPLSNFDTSFQMCLGKTNYKNEKEIIDRFWNSRFEYTHPPERRIPSELKRKDKDGFTIDKIDYDKWAKLSLEEIVKVDWVLSKKIFGDIFGGYGYDVHDITYLHTPRKYEEIIFD